jgi:hypothetical protein
LSRQVEELKRKMTNISAIPYAGVIQVRFNGYFLRPQRHPCKKYTPEFLDESITEVKALLSGQVEV